MYRSTSTEGLSKVESLYCSSSVVQWVVVSFDSVGFGLDRGSTLVCSSAFYWGMDASSHGTVCLQLKITMSTSSLYVHPLQLQYICFLLFLLSFECSPGNYICSIPLSLSFPVYSFYIALCILNQWHTKLEKSNDNVLLLQICDNWYYIFQITIAEVPPNQSPHSGISAFCPGSYNSPSIPRSKDQHQASESDRLHNLLFKYFCNNNCKWISIFEANRDDT